MGDVEVRVDVFGGREGDYGWNHGFRYGSIYSTIELGSVLSAHRLLLQSQTAKMRCVQHLQAGSARVHRLPTASSRRDL